MKKKIFTIISIALFSCFLWGSVYLSGEYSVNIKAHLVIRNIPNNLAIVAYPESNISLSVKGEGWQLAQLSLRSDNEFVVLAQNKKGKQKLATRDFMNINSWIPSTVEIVEIFPESVEFTLEKLGTKKVRIEPNVEVNSKPGYDLVTRIFLNPDSVEITGAKSVVENINSVKTEFKEFDLAEDKVSEPINLETHEELHYSIQQTQVEFDVQKIVDKTFENIPVYTIHVPATQQLILTPPALKVVLRGGINLLGKLTNEDIYLYVTYKEALTDTVGSIEPHAEIPEYTTLIDIKPHRIGYIIKKY